MTSVTRRGQWAAALSALTLVALAACSSAQPDVTETTAGGVPEIEQMLHPLPDPAPAMSAADAAAYSGVARINVTANCTGTLVDTGVPSGPAYLVTNGHCAGGWGNDGNTVVVDEAFGGTADFHAVAGALDEVLTLEVTSVAYSTMRRYDIAFVELAGTLGEATAQGLEALPLSAAGPAEGDAVVNVGVPVQDLGTDEHVLRKGECTLGKQTDLIEATWYWLDSWSTDCPGIIQGSSGSPLIADDTIAAVINTTTGGGFVRGGECSMSNPCEVGAEGTVMVPDRSYAVPVAGMGSCFGADGVFTLGGDCPLSAGGIRTDGWPTTVLSLDDVTAGRNDPGIALVSDSPVTARLGLTPANASRGCLQESTYLSKTVDLVADTSGNDDEWDVQGTSVSVNLPAQEGMFLLCVADAADLSDPAVVVLEVDGTPPVFTPGITVERTEEGAFVIPAFIVPELAHFELKHGAVGSVDCEDPAGYVEFRLVPTFIESADLPVTFCTKASDVAGNWAPTQEFTVS